MFDIGFTELLVIGVVALLVIGPERMPKVARTAGHLFGRFQRYVSNVKADISREMDVEELRRAGQTFKESVEQAARGVESTAAEAEFTMREEVKSASDKVTEALADMERHDPHLGDEVQKLRADYQQEADSQQGGPVREDAGAQPGAEVPAQGELALNEPAPAWQSEPAESASGQDPSGKHPA